MSFLEKLQNADEGMKRIALIVGSVMGMAVVIFLWFHFSGPLVTSANVASQSEANRPSFLANVAHGARYLGTQAFGFVQSGVRALTSPKSYIIKP